VVGHIAAAAEGLGGGVTHIYNVLSPVSAHGLDGGVWKDSKLWSMFKRSPELSKVIKLPPSVGAVSLVSRKKRVMKCWPCPSVFMLSCGVKSELDKPSSLPPGRAGMLCVRDALCVSNALYKKKPSLYMKYPGR
jgi:hypothetical protein